MDAGFETVLLETRHVKAALSAMTVKPTGAMHAALPSCCGLAGTGGCTQVCQCSGSAFAAHCPKLIQAKLLDLESGIRGVLRGFGLKVGPISRGRFQARIRELVDGHTMLETVIGSMLSARTALQQEFASLHRTMLTLARADPVCRQLMTVLALARSSRSPSRAASTIRPASGARAMSARTSASLLASTSPANSTSPDPSARSATGWCGPRSTRRRA